MRRGYELLKSIQLDKKIDFENFEEKNHVAIPESFKRFANQIQLGADKYYIGEFNINKVYDPSTRFIIALGWIEKKVSNELLEKIIIDRFVSNLDLLDEWRSALQSDNLSINNGILPIGYLLDPVHVRIFVGVQKGNSGYIYIDTNEEMRSKYEVDVIKVSDNIWDFVEGCEEKITNDMLLKYDSKKLVKRWGEDFWRVNEI
jgi:hypothetical protein